MAIPQAKWLNNKRFIFSWFWRLEVQNQGLSGLVSTGLLLGSHVATFLLCPHMELPLCTGRDREGKRSLCLFLSIVRHHHVGIKFNYLLEVLSPDRVTLEVRALTHEFRRGEMGKYNFFYHKISVSSYTMSFFLFLIFGCAGPYRHASFSRYSPAVVFRLIVPAWELVPSRIKTME